MVETLDVAWLPSRKCFTNIAVVISRLETANTRLTGLNSFKTSPDCSRTFDCVNTEVKRDIFFAIWKEQTREIYSNHPYSDIPSQIRWVRFSYRWDLLREYCSNRRLLLQGVSGLGRGTVLNYILSRDRGRTVTEELVGWSTQALEIGEKYKQLEGIKRKPHCSVCKHQGLLMLCN